MSKEVEKKIVEMTFDNTQFEKGVRETMTTIDKFNEKLAFNNSTDGIERIQKSFDGLNMRGAIDGLDNFTVKFSGISVFINRIIENITDDVYKAIGGISTAIDKVFNQVKTGGETRALNIEQAKFQLSGLGIAWEDIKDDINYAVKDTAYGLDAAAKAASQLVASNIQVGEEMRYSLRGISGLAAMTNSSYEDIARIFTKVAGQGRLMGDDLNSIAARGINVAAELAKVFNVTEADIRDMVSKGVIDFKTFAKAMDDAFGQHAKDANKTYAGSLSNVKAALNRLGADIATTKFEALRDIFNDLIPKIDQFKQEFKPAEEAIKRLIIGIRNLVQGVIKNIDIPKITKKISNAVVKVAETVEYLIDQFERAIKVVKRIEEINAFKKIEDDAKGAQHAVKSVVDTIKGVSEETEDNVDKIREENKELQAAKDIVNGVYGVLNGQERIDYIKDVLHMDPDVIQDYINQVYDAGKTWDTVTLATADNADKANNKYEKLSTTIKNIVKVFATIKHIAKNVFESIKNVASVMIDSFKNTFDMNISEGFSKIPDSLNDISDKFKITEERAERLRPVFDTVFSALRLVIDTISKLIGHIKNFIEWLKNNETIHNIAESVKNLFVAIFTNIKELKNRIVESDVFKNLVNNLKPIITEIGEFIGYIFNGIASIVSRATEAINELMNGRSFFDVLSEFLFGTEEKRTAFYNIIKGGFIVGLIGLIAKAIFKMRLFMNDGIFYVFKFLGVLSNLSRVLFTYKYYLRANAFTAIAKGIGLIVLSLVGLAYYINSNGSESIMQAAIIISAMIAGMLLIMHSISKIEGINLNFGGFIKASIVVRSLGLAIISISAALYFVASAMNNFGGSVVLESLGIIITAMASLVAVMFVLSKMNTSLQTQTTTSRSLERVGRVLLSMSISMLIISKAITNLINSTKDMNDKDVWIKGILPIVALMGTLTLAIIVLQKMTRTDIGRTSLIKVASVMIALSVGISLITKSVLSLVSVTSDTSVKEVWIKGILPIVALMGAIIAGLMLLSLQSTSLSSVTGTFGQRSRFRSSSLQRVASILLSMSVGIFIITKALTSLLLATKENNITTDELWINGMLPIITLITTLFIGIALFGKIVDSRSNFFTPGKYMSLALVIVGVAGSISLILLSLSHLLKVMKKNDISSGDLWNTVLSTILIFGSIIVAFIAIAKLVNGIKLLATSASLLVITATLVAVMAGLGLITTVFDMNKIWGAIGAMTALIAIISLFGGALGTAIAPGLLALSGALFTFALSLGALSIASGVASLAMIALGIALPILATGVKDTVVILVKGVKAIIDEIPGLLESLVNALGSVAYSVGKSLFVIVGNLVRGIIDGVKEMLGIASPSKVFADIGDNCIVGLFEGIIAGLKKIGSRILDAFNNAIVQPILNFFGIHSPSTLFEGIGGNLIDGLELGIQNGLSNFDTSGFSEDITSSLPNMEGLGFDTGNDILSGIGDGLNTDNLNLDSFDIEGALGGKLGNIDFSQFSGTMGEAITDSVAEGIQGVDPTKLGYSIEDLMGRPELYDILKKSIGENGVVAAYDEMMRHEDFLAKYPTFKDYFDHLEENFSEEESAFYREIMATGSDEAKDGLEQYLVKNYMDQAKLDNVVLQYSKAYQESMNKYLGNMGVSALVKQMLDKKNSVETTAKVKLTAVDEEGNSVMVGVQNLLDSGLDLNLDNSTLNTNLNNVSDGVSDSINAAAESLGQKLTDINDKINTFDTNQSNRITNITNRMDLLESAIRSMQLRLDTGALVGQLVVPLDRAFGERASRKSRG